MHKAAYGNLPGKPVPVRLREFLADTRDVGQGVQVNVGDWRAQLEANKNAFAASLTSRPEFAALYPDSMTAAQFVDALNSNAGSALSQAERDALVADVSNGARTRAQALRAVADSHKAALSVGISLEQIWVIVWFTAGIVALVTGILWGARSDVSFALQIIALKALPVLILGGFTSIPGAIVGGLIIGVGEKIGEFYWGPLIGGGIETWLAYVIALLFLLYRPQGLFGEKIIERV